MLELHYQYRQCWHQANLAVSAQTLAWSSWTEAKMTKNRRYTAETSETQLELRRLDCLLEPLSLLSATCYLLYV